METNKDERLEQAVATLNDLIGLTRSSGLHETAQFLAMAKLNLLMELNGVTEEEFRALCVALETDANSGGGRSRGRPLVLRGKRIEPRASGSPAFGKPWAAPDRLALLRSSHGRGKQ